MMKIILVAHGKLADEMKNSTEMIYGNIPQCSSVNFYNNEGFDSIQNKLKNIIKHSKEPILIMTDLFCGTPYNASCAISIEMSNRDIEIISGMSLPLVLEAVSMSSNGLTEDVNHLVNLSSDTVKVFSQVFIEEEEEL